MYKIVKFLWRRRLTSDAVLKREDFDKIAADLGRSPVRARKIARVAACRVQEDMDFETRWGGEVTANRAKRGDWIVTNLNKDDTPLLDPAGNKNQYVVTAAGFEQRYDRAVGEAIGLGPLFQAKATVEVDTLKFGAGLDILAPWGERQTIKSGYLLRNGADIYGNDEKAFLSTYEFER
jgi:hypothetical protein